MYKGDVTVGGDSNDAKQYKDIVLNTLDRESNIGSITAIPELMLNSKLEYKHFQTYLNNVFQQNKVNKGRYVLNQGWLQPSNTTIVMSNELKQKGRIASI